MTAEGEHVNLSGLLLGELTNAEVYEVSEHLDWCETCREELAEVATGHALLSSAARRLGPVPTIEPAPEPTAPIGPVVTSRGRGRRTVLIAVAATVIGVLGTAGAILAVTDRDQEPSPTRSVALEPVDGSGSGAVEMRSADPADTTMTIHTEGLPKAAADEFYYAWLFDPDTNKMLPLGQVGPGGNASFTLTDDLLERYSAIDVSLEADDGNPQHSATSVLRASYGPTESTQGKEAAR